MPDCSCLQRRGLPGISVKGAVASAFSDFSYVLPAGFRDGLGRRNGFANGEPSDTVEVADRHKSPVLDLHTALDSLNKVIK